MDPSLDCSRFCTRSRAALVRGAAALGAALGSGLGAWLALLLALLLALAPVAAARPQGSPSSARIEVLTGRARLVTAASIEQLSVHNKVLTVVGPTYLDVRPGGQVRVTWPGAASVLVHGPAGFEWSTGAPDGGASPGQGDLALSFAALGHVDLEVRRGTVDVELPRAWRTRVSGAALQLDALASGAVELTHHAGAPLSVEWVGERATSRPPVQVRAGSSVRLDRPRHSPQEAPQEARREPWPAGTDDWPWRVRADTPAATAARLARPARTPRLEGWSAEAGSPVTHVQVIESDGEARLVPVGAAPGSAALAATEPRPRASLPRLQRTEAALAIAPEPVTVNIDEAAPPSPPGSGARPAARQRALELDPAVDPLVVPAPDHSPGAAPLAGVEGAPRPELHTSPAPNALGAQGARQPEPELHTPEPEPLDLSRGPSPARVLLAERAPLLEARRAQDPAPSADDPAPSVAPPTRAPSDLDATHDGAVGPAASETLREDPTPPIQVEAPAVAPPPLTWRGFTSAQLDGVGLVYAPRLPGVEVRALSGGRVRVLVDGAVQSPVWCFAGGHDLLLTPGTTIVFEADGRRRMHIGEIRAEEPATGPRPWDAAPE
ncbi:MAG: hypothetical protein R3F49_02370 [Planctomycetota bacterium]